jgi:hypothetical protein
MGCLCLHAAVVLYRRRDVSLFQNRTIPMAQQQVYRPLQPQDNPPSSPNSSHRIAHTQAPYHHLSLCLANTHAARQNNLSIASASGLAQHHPGAKSTSLSARASEPAKQQAAHGQKVSIRPVECVRIRYTTMGCCVAAGEDANARRMRACSSRARFRGAWRAGCADERVSVSHSLLVVVGITRSVPGLGSKDCVAGSKRVG